MIPTAVFNDLLSRPAEGQHKYIFMVDDERIDDELTKLGYMPMLIKDRESADSYLKTVIEKATDGGYTKDFIFLPARLNKELSEYITDELIKCDLIVDKSAYKIFFNKAYQDWDEGQYKRAINKFLKKYESAKKEKVYNDKGFETIKGKIAMSNIDYNQLALFLIEKYKIANIKGELCRYDNGLYVPITDDEYNSMVLQETYNSSTKHRTELRPYLKVCAEERTPSDNRYTLFNNGVYDMATGALLPVGEDYVLLNRIPHNYNPTVERQEIFEKFLSDLVCGDEDSIKLLKEVIGYCFYRNNPLQVFLFIWGKGGNGKSTFTEFLSFLIGKDNVSYLTLDDMQDNFTLPQLENKLLNIGDDVEDIYIEKVGPFKKMVSGEAFQCGAKYKDKKPLRYTGKLIFTGNTIPKMNDKSDGLKRRIIILPFLNDFKKSADTDILSKLCADEVAEYAIKIGIESLKDVLNKGFTIPDLSKQALTDYEEKNNNVIEFINEHEDFILSHESRVVFTQYKNFCEDSIYKPLGKNKFYEAMRNAGYENIKSKKENSNGKRPPIFIKS